MRRVAAAPLRGGAVAWRRKVPSITFTSHTHMPSQAELNLLLNNPETFLRQHAIRWAGKGPDQQANITAALIDGGGESQARVRTGSKILGFGNKKASVSSFILRDTQFANGQDGAPGTLTFPAVWSGYAAGQARDANLPIVDRKSVV